MIPSNFFSDKLFIDKLIATSAIEFLYERNNVHLILSSNEEVFLWISPSLIVEKKDIDKLFIGLNKRQGGGIHLHLPGQTP